VSSNFFQAAKQGNLMALGCTSGRAPQHGQVKVLNAMLAASGPSSRIFRHDLRHARRGLDHRRLPVKSRHFREPGDTVEPPASSAPKAIEEAFLTVRLRLLELTDEDREVALIFLGNPRWCFSPSRISPAVGDRCSRLARGCGVGQNRFRINPVEDSRS
jgi:hypothetical protein